MAYCLKNHVNVEFELFNVVSFDYLFVILKVTCLVTLFDRKLQVAKLKLFWYELLSPQNIAFEFLINFCSIESDLSGNTV